MNFQELKVGDIVGVEVRRILQDTLYYYGTIKQISQSIRVVVKVNGREDLYKFSKKTGQYIYEKDERPTGLASVGVIPPSLLTKQEVDEIKREQRLLLENEREELITYLSNCEYKKLDIKTLRTLVNIIKNSKE